MVSNLDRIKKELEVLPVEELREVSRLINAILKQPSMPQVNSYGPGYGWAKGLITVPPDFDEPLEDFREYME